MADSGNTSSFAGRANTVLVFDQGDGAKAVISTVVVRVREKKRGKRVRFIGPATFEEKTAEHVAGVVLPAADGVLKALNLSEKYFDISVVNLDAASIMDIGLNISGFSADVPILLAILAAGLEIGVLEDIVSTGHIASPDGDIRMVKNVPAKLEAAIKAKSIKRFVHPAVAQESPLDSLSPGERQSAADALVKAKRDIRTIAVRDIGELVREIFSDEQIILASLRQGFHTAGGSPFPAETAIGRTAEFLAKNNEKRFWTTLERHLLEGRTQEARNLLLARAQFQIYRKTYPKELGRNLLRLIQSLPPQTRSLKLGFPLLPMPECIQLSQLAKETDYKDVPLLFRVVSGEKIPPDASADILTEPNEAPKVNRLKGTLQSILSEISVEALTNRISLPIDSARAAYIMDSVTVGSHEEFNETIIAFYLHFVRHIRKLVDPVALGAANADAFELLERTFSKKGGFKGALGEARTGINGGLRLVCDMMTEQFKREEQEKHINLVFKTALDPEDYENKVELMRALIKSLEPHLSPEIISQPPERFAEYYEEIIKAYLQSMDRLKSIMRSL